MLNHSSPTSLLSKQRGAATLLVAVLLLAAALVISLASYKGVFFQAKRAQNEIEARQLHWKGEGRLECVMAKVADNSSVLPTAIAYSECDQPTSIAVVRQGSSNLYRVESNEDGYKVIKIIRVPSVGAMGALSANADVYFIGSYSFNPQPLDMQAEGNPSCVSVKYSKSLYLAPNTPESLLDTQSIQTPSMVNVECDSNFKTNVRTVSVTKQLYEEKDNLDSASDSLPEETEFQGDYVFEKNFQPFEDLFGAPLTELDSIKDEFEIISGGRCDFYSSGTSVINPSDCQCDKNIAASIEAGKKLIWVNGDCDLGLGSKISLADISMGREGTIVVVYNGLLSSEGSVPFNGVLYQLYTNSAAPSLTQWDGLTGNTWANSTYSDIGEVPVMYLSGSYIPDGLVVIDAPDQLAVFQGSIKFSYNKSKIENPLGQLLKPKWLKGSWNDF